MDDWVQAQLASTPWLRYVPVVSDALAQDQWTGRTGWVHQAVLADHPDLRHMQVYACGTPVMVDAARRDFGALAGLPEDAFFADAFTSEADKALA
jgi:CDP-4-dehydro-6-deoxyglucose reductase